MNLDKMLKKYKLDELLHLIAEEDREMFNEQTSFRYKYIKRPFMTDWPIGESSWDLVDISYKAICASNDYRAKIPNYNDLPMIINNYRGYDESLYKCISRDVSQNDILLFIIHGHSQQQFIFQDRSIVIEQFNRNMEILQNISKIVDNPIDIDSIMRQITGLDLKDYNELLVAIFVLGLAVSNFTDINIPLGILTKNKLATKENIYKLIDLYTSNYNEYRNSKLEKNHFRIKPFIKTDSKKIILSNLHLLFILISEGAYWVIRNYYNDKCSQEFVNKFGEYYEKYLEQVLNYYIPKEKFTQLEVDGKKKIADWKIETDKYILLLEQKSSIAAASIKTLYPDIEQLKKYLNRLGKGFEQLDNTEKNIDNPEDKKVLKLLVHYELLYMPEVLESAILKELDKSKEHYPNTFMVGSSEIERIIYALSKGEEVFNSVIDRKLKLEEEHSNDGRSFDKILKDMEIYNDYLINYKNHFSNMLNQYK